MNKLKINKSNYELFIGRNTRYLRLLTQSTHLLRKGLSNGEFANTVTFSEFCNVPEINMYLLMKVTK